MDVPEGHAGGGCVGCQWVNVRHCSYRQVVIDMKGNMGVGFYVLVELEESACFGFSMEWEEGLLLCSADPHLQPVPILTEDLF